MGKVVAILGMTGDGKTTSTIVNPDGTVDEEGLWNDKPSENYKGMSPESHVIVNFDKKDLPFPNTWWSKTNKNYVVLDEFKDVKIFLQLMADTPKVKSIAFDTINLFLSHKEFNERKKLSFDGWRDLANDIIELNNMCITILREDQIAYIFGHVELVTDVDGKEKKMFSVIGKKLKRQPPESFYNIVIMTQLETDGAGNNVHSFITKAASSTAKTPIGMFKPEQFQIPNSLRLVDDTVRKYYRMK